MMRAKIFNRKYYIRIRAQPKPLELYRQTLKHFYDKNFLRKKIFLKQVSNVRLFYATEKCITSTTKASGAILTRNNTFFA